MEKQLAVCVLAFNQTNQILAVSRRNTTDQFGLPGGKVNYREDPITALIREVWEETYIYLQPENIKLVYTRIDEDYVVLTYYYSQQITQEPIQGDAGSVKFVEWKDLIKGPFGEYNQELKTHLNM
jgi:8-oxo-dGTP pyrophosphatase MutT (NUDIX family)